MQQYPQISSTLVSSSHLSVISLVAQDSHSQ